jgi:hypothetical protein
MIPDGFGKRLSVLGLSLISAVAIFGADFAYRASAKPGEKFDLVCRSKGLVYPHTNLIAANDPPYQFEQKWDRVFRYAVDVDSRTFDMKYPPPSEDRSPHFIVGIRGSLIVFLNDERLFETYNYKTGDYFRTEVLDAFLSGKIVGTCRRRAFSGLPAGPFLGDPAEFNLKLDP